jgi:hypothetical protein
MKKIPMLERFAAQSLVEHDGELIFSKEKFAELIVKECIARVEGCAVEFDDNHPNDQFIAGYNKGVSKTASQVKQHFGVEE